MIDTPTTTVTILGGPVTYDDLGDPIDGNTILQSGVPMAIHAKGKVVATESDTEARVVRYHTGRAPNWAAPYLSGDGRLRDERTNEIYIIDDVEIPQNAAVPQDVRLDLRRVTS